MIAHRPDCRGVDGPGGTFGGVAPTTNNRLLLFIAGAVVILSSTAAIAHIMDWIPATAAGTGEIRAVDQPPPAIAPDALPLVAGRSLVKSGCAGCGAIVSMREVGADRGNKPGRPRAETPAQAAHYYEFTIRLRDGSSRVITDANPAAWRVGERVHVIDSVTLSQR